MNIISPIDGRYSNITKKVAEYFTEYQLIKQRFLIEIDYLILLVKLDVEPFVYNQELILFLNDMKKINNDIEFYNDIKKIEKEINHDVKSIEYYIGNKLKASGYSNYVNLIHFGLTSQDVNTTAYSILLNKSRENIIMKNLNEIINVLNSKIIEWDDNIIIGRTHGQPATWTKISKELCVFVYRINQELNHIKDYKITTKLGGSIGNLTSHKILSEDIDWELTLDCFCSDNYNIEREKHTTQIHNYNNYSIYFDHLKRICGILLDLCVDMWLYTSHKDLIIVKPKKHVGSSIMPHKVNPIEFENAEGNLKIAIMWLNFISTELLTSRLQRDLTDSTILRNIGTIYGHILIGFTNIIKGMKYLQVNVEKTNRDLEENLFCMSEIENHLLRKENKLDGYNVIKNNNNITKTVEEYKKYLN